MSGSAPRVVLLSRDGNRSRYRIEGGTLDGAWAEFVRPGLPVWCEIVVYDGDPRIVSYGGYVWPTAWPALFGSHVLAVWLTDAGLEALRGAVPVPAGVS
jgi:hypothetical protein